MTPAEAKEILLLYRPGTCDAEDPEVIQALAVARENPDVARWFDQHCAFQNALRTRLRQIEVPAHLKSLVLANVRNARIIPLPTPSRAPLWLAAAACLLLLAVAGVWTHPRTVNNYSNFQARVVSTALRDYRMDIVTNEMGEVRRYLASQGVPADYEVPPRLSRLKLTGAGALRWRSNAVAMVCFNRGDNQMLFLFVVNRKAIKDAPPEKPQVGRQQDYFAVRWSRGDKTYLLAGPQEANFLQKYY